MTTYSNPPIRTPDRLRAPLYGYFTAG